MIPVNEPLFLGVVLIVIEKHDDVSVLFNGAGLPEVREHGLLILAGLGRPIELREGQNGHAELLGHNL
jgi:hypothetical protein